MRLPNGFRHGGGRHARALVVALVILVGGAPDWLGLLSPESRSAAAQRGSAAVPASAIGSPTAAATRFDEGLGGGQRAKHRRGGRAYYRRTASRHVAASVESEFMPLYREAARSFAVSWRLIASIHRQETAFSTEPSTYHGLNAFGCCAGPMQFNVKNGPVSTWKLYRQSFREGDRPVRYPHRTRSHPSVYDDFDAIMAAGALLRDGGATEALDGGSWSAAYAYYGHDRFGTRYASEVMGRAEGWERDGFCLNCPSDVTLVAEFDDAYGVDARRLLRAAEGRQNKKKRKKNADKASRKPDEKPKRREAPRRAPAERARPAPSSPPSGVPRPSPATPQSEATPPPAPAGEAAPQPTVAPPSGEATCSRLSRLLGCGG